MTIQAVRWDSGLLRDHFDLAPKTVVRSSAFLPMEMVPTDGRIASEFESRATVSSGVRFADGDLLLGRITPCLENGKLAVVRGVPGGAGFATTEVIPVRPASGMVLAEYLALILAAPDVRAHLASRMEGATGRKRLPRGVLAELALNYPSVDHQERIAKAAAAIQTSVDLARARSRDLLTLSLHAATMLIDDAAANLVNIGSLARVGNGATPARSNLTFWHNGTHPWLTSGKVHDIYISSASEMITDAALRACHVPVVPKGSVVVAITGQGKTLGNAALLQIDASVNQHLAYITPDQARLDAEYLLYFLRTQYANLRELGSSGGSTKGALTCSTIRGINVPLPPLSVQHDIASTCSVLFHASRAAGTVADSLDHLLLAVRSATAEGDSELLLSLISGSEQ